MYLSLLAAVVLFFHKPLFSAEYTFPWDFRGVQLPLITFLRDELRENRFALWNPYNYGGYPIFANIQACFFHPLVLASAFISSRLSWYSLPMLLEWIVVLQVWIGGVAAYHLFRSLGLGSAPAWTGAVMFETGSYFASRAEHIDSMMAAAWMPLAWLAVWKLREKLRCRLAGGARGRAGPVDLGRISASDRGGFRLDGTVRRASGRTADGACQGAGVDLLADARLASCWRPFRSFQPRSSPN